MYVLHTCLPPDLMWLPPDTFVEDVEVSFSDSRTRTKRHQASEVTSTTLRVCRRNRNIADTQLDADLIIRYSSQRK